MTLFNRGKTALKKIPGETDEGFQKRLKETEFIHGDRTNAADLKDKLKDKRFDVVYDINGREASDTIPLVEVVHKDLEHFVYMSSAGVYLKSSRVIPHAEVVHLDYRHFLINQRICALI